MFALSSGITRQTPLRGGSSPDSMYALNEFGGALLSSYREDAEHR